MHIKNNFICFYLTVNVSLHEKYIKKNETTRYLYFTLIEFNMQ